MILLKKIKIKSCKVYKLRLRLYSFNYLHMYSYCKILYEYFDCDIEIGNSKSWRFWLTNHPSKENQGNAGGFYNHSTDF